MTNEERQLLRGENLRRLLKERHMTQEYLANKAFVSREQVIRWCKNGTDLYSNVEWWEDFFGVEHGYFEKKHESRSTTALIGEMRSFLQEQLPQDEILVDEKADPAFIRISSPELTIEDVERFGELLQASDALLCTASDNGNATLNVLYCNAVKEQAANRGKKK